MSDDKKKVKDLAGELGISNKDVLAAAKDLGIASAKVAGSSLSDAEVSRLRGRLSPSAEPEKQEVIVRRRRKSPGRDHDEAFAAAPEQGEDAPSGAPREAEPKPASAVAPETPAGARVGDENAPASGVAPAEPAAPAGKAEAAPQDSAARRPAPSDSSEFRAEKAQPAARIVRPAEARRVDVPAGPASSEARPEPGPDAITEAGPETRRGEETQSAAWDAPSARPGGQNAENRTSGQEESPSPADVSGQAAGQRHAQPRPQGAPDQAAAPARGAEGRQERSAAPRGADGREARDRSQDAQRRQKDAARQKQTARVVRPAAFSAEPERGADGQALSSAPGMPSRSEGGEAAARPAEESVSRVRVISRPEPRQERPAQPRPRTPGGRPEARHEPRQDGRPEPRNQDSGGFRPRPGDRPTGQPPRPGAPGSRPGPSRSAGAPGAPGAAPFAPASPDSEANRKKRQKGRRTVEFTDTRQKGDEESGWSRSSARRKPRKTREVAPMGGTQPVKAVKRKIKVDEFIRVADLAHQMQLKSGEIIKVLFSLGIMATINKSLDIDTATLVANEFGYEIEKVGFSEQDIIEAQQESEDSPENYVTRPPVVTIMGHVDHGKTSLLDAIRKSSVATGEAGGITQHIGAYHVKTKKGEIVFLDTPGHEAFTAMRARGAEVTDIVVLVVAADDGVMEQTREAVNHSRAAGVPIMVAVNKMDKESANPDRVKRELAELGLVSEEWGGDTTFSYVSAKTRLGLDDLLELLALQAEILELKANPKRPALGHIIEAKLDKGRGSLGTVLIQQGTLRLGDSFVCGVHSGRVRAMFNDQGKKVKEAGPSMPVEVQGFEGVPEAGEEFICIADEKQARRIAESRAIKQRERDLAKEPTHTLENFLNRKADSVEAEVLNLVVKADVQGSLEAIADALRKMSTDKVRINLIHGGTGAISESDVLLSTASNAIIIGFNVRPTAKAKELAEHEKVDIRFYDIIYKLVEEIKSAMEGMLAPVSREVFLGSAEVRETFSVPKVGTIAGCHVSDGKITRNAKVRLLRDGVVIYNGKISSLRRFKDDVREVTKGYECGIGLENYNDLKVGDIIEASEIVEEAATL